MAALVTGVFLSGCANTVNVPLNQVTEPQEYHRPHRIYMQDGTRYSVMTFAVSDSTVTIKKLNKNDPHYGATMPMVLARSDVKTVERIEPGFGTWMAFAVGGLLVIALVAGPNINWGD